MSVTPSTAHLDAVPVGQSAVVVAVDCERPIARRLMELGVLPGTRVEVVRIAPMGCPMELRVRDSSLSIRRVEAGRVRVRPLAPVPATAAPDGTPS